MKFAIFDSKTQQFVRGANRRLRAFSSRDTADRAERALNHRRRTRRYRVQLEPHSKAALAIHNALYERTFGPMPFRRVPAALAELRRAA